MKEFYTETKQSWFNRLHLFLTSLWKKMFEVSKMFEALKLNKNCKVFSTKMLNYVPYVLPCTTSLKPYVLPCLTCRVSCMLSYLTFPFPYVVPSLTCLVPYMNSCALLGFVPHLFCVLYVLMRHVSRALCALMSFMPLVLFVFRASVAITNFYAFVLISHFHVLNCFHVNFHQIYFQLLSCSGKFSTVKMKIACGLLIEMIVSINQQYDLVKSFSKNNSATNTDRGCFKTYSAKFAVKAIVSQ